MAIETIKIFSAVNLTNSSNNQAIQPHDTDGNLTGTGDFFVGSDSGNLVDINDTDTGAGGYTDANFDDGTGANQVLNEAVTLTYSDGSGVVTTTFPAGTQVQAEFTVTFSSGFSIIGIRFENPSAPPDLINAGYAFFDASGTPTLPPPGTNLGTVVAANADGTIPYVNIPCFSLGCIIDTPMGGHPVEDLSVGDMVLTADSGPQAIRWHGRRHLDAATLTAHPNLRPIRIRAGALAEHLPLRDLVVSPQHRILVRSRISIRMFDTDEVLVPAKHLLEIEGVEIADDLRSVTYIHFMCDNHEIVRAEGALTESLYTGAEAMRAMTDDAREEIEAIFGAPVYVDRPLARPAPQGKYARRLIERHAKDRRALYSTCL